MKLYFCLGISVVRMCLNAFILEYKFTAKYIYIVYIYIHIYNIIFVWIFNKLVGSTSLWTYLGILLLVSGVRNPVSCTWCAGSIVWVWAGILSSPPCFFLGLSQDSLHFLKALMFMWQNELLSETWSWYYWVMVETIPWTVFPPLTICLPKVLKPPTLQGIRNVMATNILHLGCLVISCGPFMIRSYINAIWIQGKVVFII